MTARENTSPKRRPWGDPDCGLDHQHEQDCYPRLRSYPGYSDDKPQQRAARESARQRRIRAYEGWRRAETHTWPGWMCGDEECPRCGGPLGMSCPRSHMTRVELVPKETP